MAYVSEFDFHRGCITQTVTLLVKFDRELEAVFSIGLRGLALVALMTAHTAECHCHEERNYDSADAKFCTSLHCLPPYLLSQGGRCGFLIFSCKYLSKSLGFARLLPVNLRYRLSSYLRALCS